MSQATNKYNFAKMILDKSIFDENIIYIILKYYWLLLDKPKILLHWININNLEWKYLSTNPNDIDLLESNLDKVCWKILCYNPNAIYILEKNPHKIDWNWLSTNVNAIHLLEKNQDKINWYRLSSNLVIFEDEPIPL